MSQTKTAKTAKSTATATKAKADKSTTKDKAPAAKKATAFNKALTPSPALAAVIGAAPLARTEAVKKIWEYIKSKNLQDAANKRNINADAALKPVFGGKAQVTMFELTSLLSKNLS